MDFVPLLIRLDAKIMIFDITCILPTSPLMDLSKTASRKRATRSSHALSATATPVC